MRSRLVAVLALCSLAAATAFAENPTLPVTRINRIAPVAGGTKIEIDAPIIFHNSADRVQLASDLGIAGGVVGVTEIAGHDGAVALSDLNLVTGTDIEAWSATLDAIAAGTRTINGHALTSNLTLGPTDIGLGNVDNTSDATKNAAAVTLTNHTVAAGNLISPAVTMLPNVIVVDGDSLTCAGTQYWPTNFTGIAEGLGYTPINAYNSVASFTGGEPTAFVGSRSGTFTSGSAVITGLSSTSDLVVGQSVSAAGGLFTQEVVSIDSGSQITVNGNAVGTGTFTCNFTRTLTDSTGVKPLTSWPEQLIGTPAGPTTLYDFGFSARGVASLYNNYFQEYHLLAPNLTGVPAAGAVWIGFNNDGNDAATTYAKIAQAAQWMRADGFAPIVVLKLHPYYNVPTTDSLDTRRIAINSAIDGGLADGTIDIVVDPSTVPGLTSSVVGTSYVRDVSGNWWSGDPNHPSAAGNALLAAQVIAQMKSWAGSITSNTQRVAANADYRKYSAHVLAPWARKRLTAYSVINNSSGGSFSAPSYQSEMTVTCGTTNGHYANGYWRNHFTGYQNAKQNLFGFGSDSVNWERPIMVEFGVCPHLSGNTTANSVWQAIFGRANGDTIAALSNSDVAMGLKFVSTTSGFLDVYTVAANATTHFTSSLLTQIVDGQASTVQLYSDGNGNLTVTINGVSWYFAGVTRKDNVGSSNMSLESYTTGSSSALDMGFSDVDLSFF
ncbi:MAG: hypothetical protein P4L99_28170 [Chthoniobacter sp.]|nr:hypothetical protein [Chthoniobacter sp.]